MKILKRLILVFAIIAISIGFSPVNQVHATTSNLTQILSGSAACTSDNPGYMPLTGDGSVYTNTSWMRGGSIPITGVISCFSVSLSAAPGGVTSRIFTVQLNDADTNLVVTITGTATTGRDDVHTLNVSAGDKIRLKQTRSSVPAAANASYSAIFESNNTTDSIYMGCGYDTSPAKYCGLTNGFWNGSYVDANTSNIVPMSGAFHDFWTQGYTTGASITKIAFYVNGVQALAVTNPTVTSGTWNAGDTVNTISVNAGDLVQVYLSAPSSAYIGWGIAFTSSIEQQSMLLGNSIISPSTSAANIQPMIASQGVTWAVTNRSSGFQDPAYSGATLHDMYISVTTASGAGKSYDYAILQGGSSTGITVNISGASTTGSDTSHTWNLSGGNYFASLQFQATPNNTPTAPTFLRWGVAVSVYKIPQLTTQAATGIKESFATLHGTITILVGDATVRGFIFDTSSHAGFTGYSYDVHENGVFAAGSFSLSTGSVLVKNTTYYVRAYATSAIGTGYGNEISFTTLNPQGSTTAIGVAMIGAMTASSNFDTGLTTYSVTNIGTCAINVVLQGHDATGGVTWTLSDAGTPGADTYAVYAGTGSYSVIVPKSSFSSEVITNLGPGSSTTFGIEIKSPTSMSDSVTKNTTVTVKYVAY